MRQLHRQQNVDQLRRVQEPTGRLLSPAEIVIDLNFVDTLPDSAVVSGLGEMIHYYLVSARRISGASSPTTRSASPIGRYCENWWFGACRSNARSSRRTEFDRRERQVLNHGHSFGHAIESLTNYRIPHGIAVSFGMDVANHLSARLGYISEDERQDMRELLAWNWGSTQLGQISAAVPAGTRQGTRRTSDLSCG